MPNGISEIPTETTLTDFYNEIYINRADSVACGEILNRYSKKNLEILLKHDHRPASVMWHALLTKDITKLNRKELLKAHDAIRRDPELLFPKPTKVSRIDFSTVDPNAVLTCFQLAMKSFQLIADYLGAQTPTDGSHQIVNYLQSLGTTVAVVDNGATTPVINPIPNPTGGTVPTPTPTPATGLDGSTPAPTPGTGMDGSMPAPTPGTDGSMPTPSTDGSMPTPSTDGSVPAPTPATSTDNSTGTPAIPTIPNLPPASNGFINLSGAIIHDVNLNNANLQNANLSGTQWINVTLRGANVEGALMDRAVFRNVDVTGTNLQKANVDWADLYFATASNNSFSPVNLAQYVRTRYPAKVSPPMETVTADSVKTVLNDLYQEFINLKASTATYNPFKAIQLKIDRASAHHIVATNLTNIANAMTDKVAAHALLTAAVEHPFFDKNFSAQFMGGINKMAIGIAGLFGQKPDHAKTGNMSQKIMIDTLDQLDKVIVQPFGIRS